MRIVGCDLHARQQTVAMLDTTTGEVVNMTLRHEGNNVREFYSALPRPVRVGIECQVGHPAEIRAAEPRKQKHDRRDADLIQESDIGLLGAWPDGMLPQQQGSDYAKTTTRRHGCDFASLLI